MHPDALSPESHARPRRDGAAGPAAGRRRAWRSVLGALLAAGAAATAAAAPPAPALELPPAAISYRIDARLEPATRALAGTEEIRWTNTTGAPLEALPLHLYLNAFAHQRTTWLSEEQIGRFDAVAALLEEEPDPWGWIEPKSIALRGPDGRERPLSWRPVQPDDGNPLDRSLAEIALPGPLAPGETVTLAIAFEGRLPYPIARTGGARDFFLVGQWYPKIGVPGAARQFHSTTEFFAEFADFDVTFRVPSGWLVGATGRAEGPPAPGADGFVAHRFTQRAVHDFALVAGSRLAEATSRHAPQGGGPAVTVRYLFPRGLEALVPRWQRATEAALDTLGAGVGPYPYDHLTEVFPPSWAEETSGMEYPTFFTGSAADLADLRFPAAGLRFQEGTLVHEFAHEYFYGLLASNEQEEAYLDEGFSTYWQARAMETLFGGGEASSVLLGRPLLRGGFGRLALGFGNDRIREPIARSPSWLYAPGTLGLQVYIRVGQTIETAEKLFGRETIDRVFRAFYARWAFRHPTLADFLAVAREQGGEPLADFLAEAYTTARQPDFAVERATTARWQPPLGRVPGPAGPLEVKPATRDEYAATLAPEDARETDGTVFVEVADPGWTRADAAAPGSIARRRVAAARGPAEPGWEPEEGALHESRVRVTGPAWQHLPVELEFRFADGAVVTEAWDGRAPWRAYRFLRAAPLVAARVDPRGTIAIDPDELNDGRRIEPKPGLADDWGGWLGSLAGWIVGALTLWL